jgi:hypothetical protein
MTSGVLAKTASLRGLFEFDWLKLLETSPLNLQVQMICYLAQIKYDVVSFFQLIVV